MIVPVNEKRDVQKGLNTILATGYDKSMGFNRKRFLVRHEAERNAVSTEHAWR